MLVAPPHPLLDASAFTTLFPAPLGALTAPPEVLGLLAQGAAAPLSSGDEVRLAVRDLLRHGGFKPTGRSKPASEYLIKACEEGRLGAINAAVDVCNAVSLHSGLPISVVDLDLARPPFKVAVCPDRTSYVFNPTGQVIDVGGLVSLWDADGPCAGPVKDSQRTKTSEQSTRTLTVIWGTRALPGRTARARAWYEELLGAMGATVEDMPLSTGGGS